MSIRQDLRIVVVKAQNALETARVHNFEYPTELKGRLEFLSNMSGKTVFVVSVPWDSASVKGTYVFDNYQSAEKFCIKVSKKGYNGHTGGLFVEECQIFSNVNIGKETVPPEGCIGTPSSSCPEL